MNPNASRRQTHITSQTSHTHHPIHIHSITTSFDSSIAPILPDQHDTIQTPALTNASSPSPSSPPSNSFIHTPLLLPLLLTPSLTTLHNQRIEIIALLQLRLNLLDNRREVWVILSSVSFPSIHRLCVGVGGAYLLRWSLLLLWQQLVRERALRVSVSTV